MRELLRGEHDQPRLCFHDFKTCVGRGLVIGRDGKIVREGIDLDFAIVSKTRCSPWSMLATRFSARVRGSAAGGPCVVMVPTVLVRMRPTCASQHSYKMAVG